MEINYYNVSEVSKLVGLSETTIRNYFKSQLIPAKKIGNSWFTTDSSIKEYLQNNNLIPE